MARCELFRIKNLGFEHARFEDVQLNFIDENGMPTHSTAFLRNGGGKTSLIALYFAMLLPDARYFIGKRANRSISDYVPVGTCGATVSQWLIDDGSELFGRQSRRILLGVHYERLSEDPPTRTFFSVDVHPDVSGTTIDTIPLSIRDNDREKLLSASEFKQALNRVNEGRTGSETPARYVESIGTWTKHLATLGFSERLLRFQSIMNSEESSADKPFEFRTDQEFLDFLFRLTMPRGIMRSAEDVLRTHREALRESVEKRRPTLDFARETITQLKTLDGVSTDRSKLTVRLGTISQRLEQALEHEHTRVGNLLHQQEELDGELGSLKERLQDYERRAEAASWLARAADTHAAQLELEAAQGALEKAEEADRNAEHDEAAWLLADAVARYQRAERALADTNQKIQARTEAAKPELEMVRAAALALGQALKHRQDHLQQQKAKATKMQAQAEEDSKTAKAVLLRLTGQVASAEATRDGAEDRKNQAKAQLADAVQAGSLLEGEDPTAAKQRLSEQLRGLRGELEQARLQLAEVEADLTNKQAANVETKNALAEATRAYDEAERVFGDAETATALIRANPDIREIVADESWDPVTTSQKVEDLFSFNREERNRLAAKAAIELSSLEQAAVSLESDKLLPPTESARRAISALTEADIPGARTGAEYIAERNRDESPEEAREWVRRNPLAANGVIVPAEALDASRHALARVEEQFDSPVLLATAAQLTEGAQIPGQLFGPQAMARYHFQIAQAELTRIYERIGEARTRAEEARASEDGASSALQAWKDYRAKYSAEVYEALRSAREEANLARERAEAVKETAEEEERRAERAQQQASEIARAKQAAIEEPEKQLREVDSLLKFVVPQLNAATNDYDQAVANLLELQGSRSKAEVAEKSAYAHLEECQGTVRQVESELSQLARDVEEVRPYLPEQLDAEAGDVSWLKEQYRDAVRIYEGKLPAGELLERRRVLEEEQQKASSAVERQSSNSAASREEAEELLGALGSIEEADLHKQLQRARDAAKHASARKGEAEGLRNSAQGHHTDLARQLQGHKAPPATVLPECSTVAEAKHFAGEQRSIEADRRADARQANSQITELEKRLEEAESITKAAQSAERELETLKQKHEDLLSHADPEGLIPISTNTAATQQLRQDLEGGKKAWRRLDEQRDAAVTELRTIIGKDAYAHVQSKTRTNMGIHSEEQFEERANEYLVSQQQLERNAHDAIADAGKDRDNLVTALLSIVNHGYNTLMSVNLAAKLPLQDGRTVRLLKIGHAKKPEIAVLKDRLGRLVDSLVTGNKKTDAMYLALEAMRVTLDEVKVRIRHPDLSINENLTIAQLGKKSGGEGLTAVLVIFFTLIRASSPVSEATNATETMLRNNDFQTTTLWLDNPIGKASSPRFLHLQHQFAEQMGVQLIYSTAVRDYSALAVLPNLLWLKNETRGVHSGHAYIEESRNEPDLKIVRMLRRRQTQVMAV